MMEMDLNAHFSSSGLPRSALAAFLTLDNAAISRLSDGRRAWKQLEFQRARAFFGIVPKGQGHLVKKLRRREVRLIVGAMLANALIERGHIAAYSMSLRSASEGLCEMRADQIVALCGKFGIDLAHLTAGLGVRGANWPGDATSIVNYDLACAQVLDAPRKLSKTEWFSRRSHATRRPQSASYSPAERINCCESLIVMDDQLEPRYSRGDIIYIDTSGRECRHGDDVVVSLKEVSSVIGTLLADYQAEILIKTADSGSVLIPRNSIVEMRRISFVEC